MIKFKWSTAPRYLFRISLALEFIDKLSRFRNFLEVGCGSGDLLVRLNKKGFSGVGIDYEQEAVNEAKKRLKYNGIYSTSVLKKDLFQIKNNTYELILMMDVLEHIKQDTKALKKINSILKPNGYFIMSVPCHMSKWCLTDTWGHIRRYERNELTLKLEKSGFQIIKFYCFGFPFLNIIKPIREFLMKQQFKRDSKAKKFTKEETTRQSGLYRPFQRYFAFLSNKYFLFPFMLIQRLFFNYELGTGYVVLARKR